jgi:hypothetical protein
MGSPGTVSRILWHFTGGPVWSSAERRQSTLQKPATAAYNNLLSILRTRELRLGTYKEQVIVAPKPSRAMFSLESVPVCCVADIPVSHLGYHAQRYGKFAIGFHRHSLTKAGFNSVLYCLHQANPVTALWDGMQTIEGADFFLIDYTFNQLHAPAPIRRKM